MRFFKYGEKGSEILAIVLPGSIQRSSMVKEGDEYEFIELAPGAFFLASKAYLSDVTRKDLVAKLGAKVFESSVKPAGQTTAAPVSQTAVPAPVAKVESPKQWAAVGVPQSASKNYFEGELEKQGFLVVENEAEAKELSKALEARIKTGDVKGVRGFDKKFYIVSREFYESNVAKVMNSPPKSEFTAAEVTGIVKTPEPGAAALLQVMKEEGQLLEKRRGYYQIIR
jgi:hypothetical protein